MLDDCRDIVLSHDILPDYPEEDPFAAQAQVEQELARDEQDDGVWRGLLDRGTSSMVRSTPLSAFPTGPAVNGFMWFKDQPYGSPKFSDEEKWVNKFGQRLPKAKSVTAWLRSLGNQKTLAENTGVTEETTWVASDALNGEPCDGGDCKFFITGDIPCTRKDWSSENGRNTGILPTMRPFKAVPNPALYYWDSIAFFLNL